MHYCAVILLTISLLLACQSKTPQPELVKKPESAPPPTDTVPKMVKPILTQSQLDALRQVDGKPLSDMLWAWINTHEDKEKPDTIHVIIGNIDKDAEDEVVIWYVVNQFGGNALCFDHRDTAWYFVGMGGLDYWHGHTPPRIDKKMGALVITSYGWGSNYSSESLSFLQCRDSLIAVLELVKEECNGYIPCYTASRTVWGKYKVENDSTVYATYTYELRSEMEGKHEGEPIFRSYFTVPYLWKPEKLHYEPVLPKGSPEISNVNLPISDDYFEQYFNPSLERIRQKGPKWKRQSLGVYFEE